MAASVSLPIPCVMLVRVHNAWKQACQLGSQRKHTACLPRRLSCLAPPPPPRSDGLAVTLGQRLVVLRGLRSPRPTPSVDFVSAVDAPEALTALAWLAAAGSGGAGGGAAAGALQGADAEASHARCSQHMQG